MSNNPEITTREQLEQAVWQYEDMMAELQPLISQKDELYKAIQQAVIDLDETVVTDSFIYQCKTRNTTDHKKAVALSNVTQQEIDAATTVTIKLTRDMIQPSWLDEMRRGGADVKESTSWSSIKTPKAIRDMVTKEASKSMKVTVR